LCRLPSIRGCAQKNDPPAPFFGIAALFLRTLHKVEKTVENCRSWHAVSAVVCCLSFKNSKMLHKPLHISTRPCAKSCMSALHFFLILRKRAAFLRKKCPERRAFRAFSSEFSA
jgi:hypothetical protein